MNFVDALRQTHESEHVGCRPVSWRGSGMALVFSGNELVLWDKGRSAKALTIFGVTKSDWNGSEEFVLAVSDVLGEWETIDSDTLMSELDLWIDSLIDNKTK